MRRPPLAIAAAGLTVLVVASLLLLVLGPTGDEAAPRSGPPHASGGQLSPAGQRSSVPVLLVHGYAGAPSQMQALADRLSAAGRRVVLVQLPRRGTLDIHLSALALAQAARDVRAPVVDVIGFSLGGIAARQWLLLNDRTVRLRHLVMLATPNYGIGLPDDSGVPEQQHCEPGNACGQLRPFSPFLRQLDESPLTKGRTGWLSIASESDRLVRPPSIVALPGALNLVLQQVCPGLQVDHGQMDDTPAVLGLVTLFLDDRLPAPPTCADALGAAST